MAHATELATLMAMAFLINCNYVCRTALLPACRTVLATDLVMAHVMELAMPMAMAFLISCAFAMAVELVCNTVPVQCRVDVVKALVRATGLAMVRASDLLRVRALDLVQGRVWDKVLECVTVPALVTKQRF
jgi:hypothetical protein